MCSSKEKIYHDITGAETEISRSDQVLLVGTKSLSLIRAILFWVFLAFWNQTRVVYTDSNHGHPCSVVGSFDNMFDESKEKVRVSINYFLRRRQPGKSAS